MATMHEPRGGHAMDAKRDVRTPYEAPTLTVLGTVESLTEQQDKKYGESDGFTFLGVSITNNSA
jgi:hypothetical protein